MDKKCNVIAVWHDIAGEITFSKFWVAICILLAMCVLFCGFSFLCNSQGLEGHATEWLKAAYLKEPFTTVVWAVWRESNRGGETHVISLESHSHPYAWGTLGGGPESHKISSFWGRDTMALGRTQPLQKRVILKGGNQSNQSPAPFSSQPPICCHASHCWTQLENREREPGWHSPHCLATQGTEHAEYMELVGQTECPAERVRDLWLWEILAHFMSHLIKLHPSFVVCLLILVNVLPQRDFYIFK